MDNCKSTVTLSLEDYENMKKEIADLKEQVKQKTIIKYVSRLEDYKKLALIIIGITIFVWTIFH